MKNTEMKKNEKRWSKMQKKPIQVSDNDVHGRLIDSTVNTT
jgi:hypothetical protein